MILLVDKIEKSFGARVLFSGASFQINPGERFALVGPNGAGKTTMLKIIMGIDSPDAGQVQYAKDCQVGYLEQETNLEQKDTTILAEVMAAAKEIRRMGERANELQAQITELSEQGNDVDALLNEYGQVQDRFEHLGGYELESNARKILSGLGFKVTDFERPCSEFSGGWQMRIALAKLFLRHPDLLLLLDEPTNHLDLESVQWLRGFIANYDGAVLIVSHDRAFMDACVDHVAALENRRVTTYTGNYSSYLKQREDNLEQMRAKRAAQERDIAHMQVFVDKFRYKPTKAAQAQERIRKIEQIKKELVILPEGHKHIDFKFPDPPRSGDMVVGLEGVSKSYGDKHIYRMFTFLDCSACTAAFRRCSASSSSYLREYSRKASSWARFSSIASRRSLSGSPSTDPAPMTRSAGEGVSSMSSRKSAARLTRALKRSDAFSKGLLIVSVLSLGVVVAGVALRSRIALLLGAALAFVTAVLSAEEIYMNGWKAGKRRKS